MTQTASQTPISSLWRWIPTLYFAQAIPYVAVMTLSVIMFRTYAK